MVLFSGGIPRSKVEYHCILVIRNGVENFSSMFRDEFTFRTHGNVGGSLAQRSWGMQAHTRVDFRIALYIYAKCTLKSNKHSAEYLTLDKLSTNLKALFDDRISKMSEVNR